MKRDRLFLRDVLSIIIEYHRYKYTVKKRVLRYTLFVCANNKQIITKIRLKFHIISKNFEIKYTYTWGYKNECRLSEDI